MNGLWNFAFLGAVDVDQVEPERVLCPERVLVPSAFDAMPIYAGKRGVALYRTRLTVPPGQRARIHFGAVSILGRIYVDGVLLKENACGYAPFDVDLPPAQQAERELSVLVDNRFDFSRVPMHEECYDFYQYGGIIRDVTLRVLPGEGFSIDQLQVTPGEDYLNGEIKVAVFIGGIVPASVRVKLQIGGMQVDSVLPVCDGVARLQTRVPEPLLWSPADPHLHTVRLVLIDEEADKEVDDVSVRFGLRRIEAREGALWLNGERIELRGYNRHEWHPNYGPCTPTLQMMADLEWLRDLGCNFVRGSHYPQDQRFLDLCDDLGMLVWEENLGWGQREKTFSSAKWHTDHAEALHAMVRESYNHPSVIIWGFLNEAGTKFDYVRATIEKTCATLRALDPSRLIAYATMFATEDRHYDLIDLISINIYPGWYNCEGVDRPLELIEPRLRECLDSIDARGFGDKPVLVSEIGVEALYGWRDPHGDFYTEEYQAEYLRRACRAILDHPRCSGVALWHFSDVRTYGGGYSMRRPRTFNNKGTLDEYRRPKAAYATVREIFREAGSAI